MRARTFILLVSAAAAIIAVGTTVAVVQLLGASPSPQPPPAHAVLPPKTSPAPAPTVLSSAAAEPEASTRAAPKRQVSTLEERERQHCDYTAANLAWWQKPGNTPPGSDTSVYEEVCKGRHFDKLLAAGSAQSSAQLATSATSSCSTDLPICPKGYKEGVRDQYNPYGCNFYASTAANPCEYKLRQDNTPDLYSTAQKWAAHHLFGS